LEFGAKKKAKFFFLCVAKIVCACALRETRKLNIARDVMTGNEKATIYKEESWRGHTKKKKNKKHTFL
jgi:hypothetical protein